MPSLGQPINVLEIGYGDVPAVAEGSLFKNPDVNHIGIELPKIFEGCFKRYKRFGIHDVGFPELEANMSMLPFRDESFDYVLMRSVYGQFGSRHEITDSVRHGMKEVIRVLKPEAQVVIAEENTPSGREYIECELESNGFVIDGHYEMGSRWEDTAADGEYRTVRGKFYDGKPLENLGWVSLTIGHKPAGLATKVVTVPMYTDFYKPDRNDGERKIEEVTFQFPVR